MTDFAHPRAARTAALLTGLSLVAVLLAFTVVVLGAYVRLTAAGLGCPDWPGCYGHLTPLGAEQAASAGASLPGTPLDVGKAWREMIHRYGASTLGLTIAVIAALALARRREHNLSPAYAVGLLALVIVQGALGMLTVTWQLKPLIVTLHLLFGLTTLSMAWWLWLTLRAAARRAPAARGAWPASHAEQRAAALARALVALGLVVLAVQIALGGWTSSNYAAIACPDLPTCQNAWWPSADFRDAFVLWRAPSINYEGGVLGGAARVAIHFTHRLGALAASLALLFAVLAVWRARTLDYARGAALLVLAALGLQLTIGLSMVHYGFPLPLATAHNAGAALTLLAVIALYHRLHGRPDGRLRA